MQQMRDMCAVGPRSWAGCGPRHGRSLSAVVALVVAGLFAHIERAQARPEERRAEQKVRALSHYVKSVRRIDWLRAVRLHHHLVRTRPRWEKGPEGDALGQALDREGQALHTNLTHAGGALPLVNELMCAPARARYAEQLPRQDDFGPALARHLEGKLPEVGQTVKRSLSDAVLAVERTLDGCVGGAELVGSLDALEGSTKRLLKRIYEAGRLASALGVQGPNHPARRKLGDLRRSAREIEKIVAALQVENQRIQEAPRALREAQFHAAALAGALTRLGYARAIAPDNPVDYPHLLGLPDDLLSCVERLSEEPGRGPAEQHLALRATAGLMQAREAATRATVIVEQMPEWAPMDAQR